MNSVLLIDNSPEEQKYISGVLREKMSVLVTASSMEEAKAKLKVENIDLIMVDFKMRDRDSQTVYEWLKYEEGVQTVFIVDPEDMQEALREGIGPAGF